MMEEMKRDVEEARLAAIKEEKFIATQKKLEEIKQREKEE